MKMDEDLKKTIKTLGFVSTVGLSMGIAIALGALIGYYLDKWLDTSPWLLLIFLGLGIAAAFRNLYIMYKRVERL
jgi:F0F1-type ATP synthase assembly protein I